MLKAIYGNVSFAFRNGTVADNAALSALVSPHANSIDQTTQWMFFVSLSVAPSIEDKERSVLLAVWPKTFVPRAAMPALRIDVVDKP